MSGAVRIVSVGAPVGGAGHPEAAAIAAALADAGLSVGAHVVVDDDEPALAEALGGAGVTAVVASAGGSAGDSVRRVLARISGARLLLSERMRALLDAQYAQLDRPVPRSAERLALLPQGAAVAETGEPVWTLETAGAAWVVFLRGRAGDAVHEVLVPLARERLGARGAVAVRTLKTAGVSAEEIEDRLAGRIATDDVVVSTIPGDGEVWVRLRARARTAGEAEERLAPAERAVAAVLGGDCYGRDGDSLEDVVGRLLRAHEMTLAVAESCTGGLVSHRITAVAGSSEYFERGVTVSSSRAKQELLGVDEEILRTHGAVSAACAEAMAKGIAERAGAACGLSITGFTGPDGGTPTKPLGTVFIGVSVEGNVRSQLFRFSGDRTSVTRQSSVMALDMLRRSLESHR